MRRGIKGCGCAIAVLVIVLGAAGVGLLLSLVHVLLLRRHLRGPVAVPATRPPISILKPLCGLAKFPGLTMFVALEHRAVRCPVICIATRSGTPVRTRFNAAPRTMPFGVASAEMEVRPCGTAGSSPCSSS